MPKVCFFNIAAGSGGSERSLLEILRGLKGSPYEPLLAVPVEGPLADKARLLGVPVFIHPLPALLMRLGRFAGPVDYLRALGGALPVSYCRWWAQFLKRERVDILHTNSVKTTFLTVPIRRLRGRPRIVWHIRDVMRGRRSFFPLVDTLGRYVPDALVANSDFTAAQFSRCRSRVVRIYNGLVTEDYRPATPAEKDEFKGRWNVPKPRRLIGMLGVLAPLKGHRVFLETAQSILRSREDVHFFVVGDEIYDTAGHRGYRQSLEEYASKLGIADRVTFTGFLDRVEQVIPCFDVLVQSSTEPESFGRVVVEAQLSGVPVVASRIGAIPEIISNRDIGTLVTPGSVEETARGVLQYLNSDELHRQTASAAREHAVAHFSVRRVVDELSSLYDGLLRERIHCD